MTLMKIKEQEPLDPELYDESAGYEDDLGIRLASGLTEQERRHAGLLYRLFNELWGLCIVVGEPGAGKDVFINYMGYTLKRYFPRKRTLRDEKPRRMFGQYAGLFNREVLSSDLRIMADVAKGVGAASIDQVLEKAADDWVTEKGTALLHNSFLLLTEFWKYVYNREPHNPMNKTMGAVHKLKRHINTLLIGGVQLTTDLDKKTALPFIDWRVNCNRSRKDTTQYMYFIEKIKYDRRKDILISTSKPLPIPVDAGKPRSFIGDGKIVIRKPYYRPETEEERIVLDVIKAGGDNYEEIVEFLENEGDMSEFEILATLKTLCLKLPGRRPKFVVKYPCYYFLYNSRSAPQIEAKF